MFINASNEGSSSVSSKGGPNELAADIGTDWGSTAEVAAEEMVE